MDLLSQSAAQPLARCLCHQTAQMPNCRSKSSRTLCVRLAGFLVSMKNPKTSFRVESHNGRLYLHGQNTARFSSRGRRMPSTVCRLFSYLLVQLRRYPNGGSYLYRSAFSYTNRNAAQNLTVTTSSVPCGGTVAVSCSTSFFRPPIPFFCCLNSAFAHNILVSVPYGRQRTICCSLSFPSLQSLPGQRHPS